MFNVLPENLKMQIKKEYRLRLLIVIFICIIFVLSSLLIFMLPPWVISSYKEWDVSSRVSNVSKSLSASNANAISAVVSSTNLKLNIINNTLQYPEITPIINVILINKTSGITIREFLYTSPNPQEGSITINGVANSREALVRFSKTLEQTKVFKTVDLPVSNLAKGKNIEFSVNLTILK